MTRIPSGQLQERDGHMTSPDNTSQEIALPNQRLSGSKVRPSTNWDLNNEDPTLDRQVDYFQSRCSNADHGRSRPDRSALDLTADDPTASSLVLRGHNSAITGVAISVTENWATTAGITSVRLGDLDLDRTIRPARRYAELTPGERELYEMESESPKQAATSSPN